MRLFVNSADGLAKCCELVTCLDLFANIVNIVQFASANIVKVLQRKKKLSS